MKPNIILVLLDGARVDRITESQEFEELRKEGILLNNVTTAIPYTMGAINVIMSGLYGKENGVDGYNKILGLKESVKILPEILKENGYFTSCQIIRAKVIANRGFDVYLTLDEFVDDGSINHPILLKKSFELAKGKPVFSFIQFGGIHTMTTLEVLNKFSWNDKKFYKQKNMNQKKYDNAIKNALKYAKQIKKTINNLGKSNDTILIFFSDHGTGLGERFGERSYGVYCYEETIRTFYLFIGKGIQKDKIFENLCASIDIMPTILGLCDVKTDNRLPGQSFAPVLYENIEKLSDNSFTFCETGAKDGPFPSTEEPNVFCIKTPRYKLIYFQTPNQWKLYDLLNDPSEINDLSGKDLEVENSLRNKLLLWINRHHQ